MPEARLIWIALLSNSCDLLSDPVMLSNDWNAGRNTSSAIPAVFSRLAINPATSTLENDKPKLSTAVARRLAAASSAAKALTAALL